MAKVRWLLLSSVLLLSACVVAPLPPPRPYIAVRTAPPPERVEVITASPGADYFWIRGHWRWENGQHVWLPGHWQARQAGSHWVPAHWVPNGPNWDYVPGHWAPN